MFKETIQEIEPRDRRVLWALPLIGGLILLISAAVAMALAKGTLNAVPDGDRAPDMTIALMRWAVLYSGSNLALLALLGLSVFVIVRTAKDRRRRSIALTAPILVAIVAAGAMFLTEFRFGPLMTDDSESVSAATRDVVRATMNPILFVSVLYAGSACALLAFGAGRTEGADEAVTLQHRLRILLLASSVALVLGAAQVQGLFSIAAAETGREDLIEVANAWAMTVGAYFSFMLLAFYLPAALVLGSQVSPAPASAPVAGKGGAAPSAPPGSPPGSPVAAASGALMSLLKGVEPLLAMLAPFLSGVLSGVIQ